MFSTSPTLQNPSVPCIPLSYVILIQDGRTLALIFFLYYVPPQYILLNIIVSSRKSRTVICWNLPTVEKTESVTSNSLWKLRPTSWSVRPPQLEAAPAPTPRLVTPSEAAGAWQWARPTPLMCWMGGWGRANIGHSSPFLHTL